VPTSWTRSCSLGEDLPKQYPRLSVTEDLRASGAGAPGLVSGKGEPGTRRREMFPAEEKSFADTYGYKPFAIKVREPAGRVLLVPPGTRA